MSSSDRSTSLDWCGDAQKWTSKLIIEEYEPSILTVLTVKLPELNRRHIKVCMWLGRLGHCIFVVFLDTRVVNMNSQHISVKFMLFWVIFYPSIAILPVFEPPHEGTCTRGPNMQKMVKFNIAPLTPKTCVQPNSNVTNPMVLCKTS